MKRYNCDITFNDMQPGVILSFKASNIYECIKQVFDTENTYMDEEEIETIRDIVIDVEEDTKTDEWCM